MIFFIKILALAAGVLLVGHRSIFGPQKLFSRLSLATIIAGVVIVGLSSRDDFSGAVGSVLILIGTLVSFAMVSFELVYILNKVCSEKQK
jgi:hypothetical protein